MKITVIGAAREVTGSCHLLELAGRRVLIDCGLYQGGIEAEDKNAAPFPFDPAGLDAVVLTHAHVDHSGRLPLLVKSGFRGHIYTHRATRDLCRIMLRDSAYLMERGAEWDNRKRRRKHLDPVQPLYTMRDATAATRRLRGVDYATPVRLCKGVVATFRDAGHILGSATVEIGPEDGMGPVVLFSGDLGHAGAPMLRDPAPPPRADLVFLESTYGDRCHRPWADTWQEIGDILAAARAGKGNILIPSFAVGRTQQLLYVFRHHFDAWGLGRWRIFVDSPMAIEATAVHECHQHLLRKEAQSRPGTGPLFDLPNLQLTRTAAQSMTLNKIKSGAIIIAASGMCTGGRVRHHLKNLVWRADCHVMIVGFQARGTTGRKLVDGADHIRLWGEDIKVGAKIHTVGGLSAHADRDGLVDWINAMQGRPAVALVHGESEGMDHLAKTLQHRLGIRAECPAPGDVVRL